jgi:hypothetical protein
MGREVAVMIWLYHRRGEYLSCEVRTCLQNAGYELCMLRPDSQTIEWYPDVETLEARWRQLRKDLLDGGWGEMGSPRASA